MGGRRCGLHNCASAPNAPELCTQERLSRDVLLCVFYHNTCKGLWLSENQAQVEESRAHHPARLPPQHPELLGPHVQGHGPELFGVGFKTASSLRVHVHYTLARCHFLFLSRKKAPWLVNGGCRGTSNALTQPLDDYL